MNATDPATEIISACYGVTGVPYFIRQPGLLQNCLTVGQVQHKEISWNQKGAKGDPGDPGPAGPPGPDGATGAKGATGDAGPQGPTGEKGPPGDKGPAGDQGATGEKGLTGDKGPEGDKGPVGDKGPAGDKGPTGDQGALGEKGPQGDKGLDGDKGPVGDKGPEGDKGPLGDKGPIGDQGPIGDKGPVGDQGPIGDKGPPGDQGAQGQPGAGCSNGCVTTAALADLAVTNQKLATITAAGKIANSATTATSENVPNTIVLRDNLASFKASEITLTGNLRLFGSAQILFGGQRMVHAPAGGRSTYLGIDAGPPDGGPNPEDNTGVGSLALRNLSSGTSNTAIGASAARNVTTGIQNTVVGAFAMDQSSAGSANTVIGYQAGRNIAGARNIVIGAQAGAGLTAGDDNILIGNPGTAESNTIRIGTAGTHTRAFMAGIQTSQVTGLAVHITPQNQLGILVSSARFKTDIRDLGSASAALYRLRPVSYQYRPDIDSAGTLQYGLIAEEVDRVAPALVVRDSTGRPYTVRYNMLVPMLVNELQSLDRDITAIEKQNEAMLRRLERLETARVVKP
jgi:hypothetical protein